MTIFCAFFFPPSLLAYTEQYLEYDPFLVPPDPSNPWISDDTTFWELEARYMYFFISFGVRGHKRLFLKCEDCRKAPTQKSNAVSFWSFQLYGFIRWEELWINKYV